VLYEESGNIASANPYPSFNNSHRETFGEQPEVSVAAKATAKPSGCSPNVSQRKLLELGRGFAETMSVLTTPVLKYRWERHKIFYIVSNF
jgi:hypothetical protein